MDAPYSAVVLTRRDAACPSRRRFNADRWSQTLTLTFTLTLTLTPILSTPHSVDAM